MNNLQKILLESREDLNRWKEKEITGLDSSSKASILCSAFKFKHPTKYPCLLVYKWRDDFYSVQDKLEYIYVYEEDYDKVCQAI